MGVIGDICRKLTRLTDAQIESLEKAGSILGLASDLAHAQITIYVRATAENHLVAVAQAKPNTSYIQYKPYQIGTLVSAAEEPMVWRTLSSGEQIIGEREWAIGMDVLEMRVFPFRDGAGAVFAAISCETSGEELSDADPAKIGGGQNILLETAYIMLTSLPAPVSGSIYRPISARDGIIIVNEQRQIVFSNAAASSIYKGLGVGRLLGKRTYDRQMHMRAVQKAINTGLPAEVELEPGNMVLLERIVPVVRNNKTLCTVVIIADVTEIRKKEKELLVKSAVIQEIHHRVKNNLQTIASLLRLQARRSASPEVKAALRESVNRILSISVVHEFLSQQDAEFIDVAEVTKNILNLIIKNMVEPDFNIQTILTGETIVLPSERATSLALVINELIQNSLEHGFVGRCEGLVGVNIATDKKQYRIEIYDNGVGLPPDYQSDGSGSLGLQIVRTLVQDDLGGEFSIFSRGGTHAVITIPRTAEGG